MAQGQSVSVITPGLPAAVAVGGGDQVPRCVVAVGGGITVHGCGGGVPTAVVHPFGHRAVTVRPAGGAVAVVIVVGGHLPAVASVGGGASRPVVAEGLRVPLLVGGCRGQGAAVPRRRGAFDCICSMK